MNNCSWIVEGKSNRKLSDVLYTGSSYSSNALRSNLLVLSMFVLGGGSHASDAGNIRFDGGIG